MKRILGYALILSLTCFSMSASTEAAAPVFETEYSQETPLIVIRFNQPNVMYQRALYETLSQALKVKPQAVFDIVSVATKARDRSMQKHYNEIAAANSNKVLMTIKKMGMPESRYNLIGATDNVSASEVRIFVK